MNSLQNKGVKMKQLKKKEIPTMFPVACRYSVPFLTFIYFCVMTCTVLNF